jgi:ATP-dependent Clp protease adaptor protein ClpS
MGETVVADPEVEALSGEELEKLYHVIILNDDDHTFEYVIEMLQAVFGFGYETALVHTLEAHSSGSSIVLTCGISEAERKRDAVHAYGPDWRMPNSLGSVTALIEPAG